MFVSAGWWRDLDEKQGVTANDIWHMPPPGCHPMYKKFIFVPMHVSEGTHWALGVIVNPSAIDMGVAYAQCNYGRSKKGHKGSFKKNQDAPVILYMDAAGKPNQSKANTNCKKLRLWLNNIWPTTRGLPIVSNNPFTYKTSNNRKAIRIVPVEVPMQVENTECGIYVCAYITGMMHLINEQFTFHDLEDNFQFVTKSEAFKFDSTDIFNFNACFRKLINESTKLSKASK